MLTTQEKQHIKSILQDAFNINPNINFVYYLKSINETNNNVKAIESEISRIERRQQEINDKLDRIIRKLNS